MRDYEPGRWMGDTKISNICAHRVVHVTVCRTSRCYPVSDTVEPRFLAILNQRVRPGVRSAPLTPWIRDIGTEAPHRTVRIQQRMPQAKFAVVQRMFLLQSLDYSSALYSRVALSHQFRPRLHNPNST